MTLAALVVLVTLLSFTICMMDLKTLVGGRLRGNERKEGPMSSKRHVRRNSCGNKRRFPDERSAEASMLRAARWINDGSTMHPYRCSWCGQWHYGHRTYRLDSIIAQQAVV